MEELYIFHDNVSTYASSVKLILCASAIYGFGFFSYDVVHGNFRNKNSLSRKRFIDAKTKDLQILNLSKVLLLERTNPLYGLCDAADYWAATMEQCSCTDLGSTSMIRYAALYIKIGANGVNGLTGCYMVNKHNSDNTDFEPETEQNLRLFEYRP